MANMKWIFTAFVASLVFAGCSADDSSNQPPDVNLDVANDVTVVVGETLSIVVRAQDPEGGDLQFDFEARPAGQYSVASADFLDGETQALFQWGPIASDVTGDEPMRLIFIVTDSAGKVTEKTVNVTIVPGNGVPRFQNSQSELYDPRIGKPLTINVEVRDDDSNEVQLSLKDGAAPPGSEFEQIGPFEGIYEWQPTVGQLMRRVHSVTFVADDGQNDAVEYQVSIVIRTRSAGQLTRDSLELDCPGEAVIQHDPLLAQKGFDDYIIEASLAPDAAALYDKMVVYWTLGDPYGGDQCDLATGEGPDCVEGIELTSPDDTNYSGSIGNQAAIDAAATVNYQICAIDEEGDGANAVVCAPSVGEFELFHSFAVLQPDESDACVDDFFDQGDGGNNDFASATQVIPDDFNFGRTCEDDEADFYSLAVQPGEKYLFAAIYPDGVDVEVNAYDDAESTIQISDSDCTGLSGLEVGVPEDGSPSNFYLEIKGGDDISYQVTAVLTQDGSGGCVDDALEPNDEPLDAAEAGDGSSIEAEICRQGDVDLYAIELAGGDVLNATTNFTNANGNLDMELFAPSQADAAGADGIGDGVEFTFSLDDMETLTHEAEETGTYYLMVFNNNPTRNSYTLDISIDAAPPCNDDDTPPVEGDPATNHTQGDAWRIPQPDGNELVTISGQTACPGQPDWFQRTEFAGAQVLGELRVDSGGTIDDISMEVYDLQSNLLTSGTVNGERIDFDFEPAATGQIYIKIVSSVKLDYTLDLLR